MVEMNNETRLMDRRILIQQINDGDEHCKTSPVAGHHPVTSNIYILKQHDRDERGHLRQTDRLVICT